MRRRQRIAPSENRQPPEDHSLDPWQKLAGGLVGAPPGPTAYALPRARESGIPGWGACAPFAVQSADGLPLTATLECG